MTRIDKGEVIKLDEIIAQESMNKNVLEYMIEMKLDQNYAFHESSDSSDDISINQVLTNETQPDEEGEADGRLKVPKPKKLSDRRVS